MKLKQQRLKKLVKILKALAWARPALPDLVQKVPQKLKKPLLLKQKRAVLEVDGVKRVYVCVPQPPRRLKPQPQPFPPEAKKMAQQQPVRPRRQQVVVRQP